MDMTKQERDKLRELALAATPGEWRVASDLPAYAIYAESGRRVVQTPNQNNRKQWGPSDDTHGIDRISDAAYIAAANPKTVLALLDRVDELEGDAEPVAWFHENPLRADAISDYVKSLLVDGESSPGGIHRPMDEGNKYSIPLYRRPPTERAVPEGWKLVPVEPTFEMLTAADTESVNKNGVMAMTRAYKAMLAAAPSAGGGE